MNTITKEQLFHEYLVNNKTLTQIGKELNISDKHLSYLGIKWGLPTRPRIVNYKDKVLGSLTVLEYHGLNKNKKAVWVCECKCGQRVLKEAKYLARTINLSCGCEPALNKKYKDENYEGFTQELWNKFVQNAKRRGIEFSITKEYVYKIYLEQDRKCKFTKLPIKFATEARGTASIDRINSKKGYIEGNIQIVHKHINFMKQAFTDDYYKCMCGLVAQNNNYSDKETTIFQAYLEWEHSGGLAVYQKIVKQQDKIRKPGEFMTKEQLKERVQAFLSFGEILAKATKNPQDDQFVKFLQTILSSDVAFDILYFVYTKVFNKDTMKFDNLKSFLSVNSD